MKELVFLEPNCMKSEPFTTSDVIAEMTGNSYRSVQRTIEKHLNRLEKFGQVRFEITAVKYARGSNDKKVYQLNEPQATLLITFLKNTDIVADFKTELVRQFYTMRAELLNRQINRQAGIPIRRELTDEIQSRPDKGKWSYKLYTDLAYKMVTGYRAAALREHRGAKKGTVAKDYMTAEEMAEVTKLEYRISVLHEMGMDYEQIKAMLMNCKLAGKIA